MLYLVIDQVCLQVTELSKRPRFEEGMQKNSEIRLISLMSIKTRSCLYPMLPFEFGIAVLNKLSSV
jgi:hypothetical protein